jgi:hypothetical protein
MLKPTFIRLLPASMLAVASLDASAVPTTNYGLLTTIAIPASNVNSQGGNMTGFDISFVDPVTGNYYFADRSNASVDIFSGATNTFLGRAGGFAGQLATTSVSGPDGVLVVNNGVTATLYAGDGGSTLRSFNVTNPTNPIAGGTVNTGGGAFRVDEMAYSPATHSLFVANNANTPSFASLISTATPLAPTLTHGNITVPSQTAADGGLEQSVWNAATGTFFVSVPTFNGTDAGGVQEFSSSGAALRTYNFTAMGIASCSPAGLGLGASGNLMVGCGNANTQTVVLNPAGAGSIVATRTAVSGSDELWFDPTSADFFVTGVNAAGDRVIDIFSDSDDSLLQSIDLTALGAGDSNLHSVAVDPLNGEIFVPLTGSTAAAADTLCPNGCVAVFAERAAAVPEPGSLPLAAIALAAMLAVAARTRRNR